MNTRRLLRHPSVIAGGGAIEMELSAYLRDESRKIYGEKPVSHLDGPMQRATMEDVAK